MDAYNTVKNNLDCYNSSRFLCEEAEKSFIEDGLIEEEIEQLRQEIIEEFKILERHSQELSDKYNVSLGMLQQYYAALLSIGTCGPLLESIEKEIGDMHSYDCNKFM